MTSSLTSAATYTRPVRITSKLAVKTIPNATSI